MFFPVLLRGRDSLGRRVFGKRQHDRIVTEVTALTEFLNVISAGRIGQKGNPDFDRDCCRVALVIVGKALNITERGEAWFRLTRTVRVRQRTETIYLVGPSRDVRPRTLADRTGAVYD